MRRGDGARPTLTKRAAFSLILRKRAGGLPRSGGGGSRRGEGGIKNLISSDRSKVYVHDNICENKEVNRLRVSLIDIEFF